MTMTNSKSATRLKSLADAPDVTNVISGKQPKVLVRMTKDAEGLNRGEVARFPKSKAQELIEKGKAVLEKAEEEVQGNLAQPAEFALNRVRAAMDAQKNLAKRKREVAMVQTEAEEAVARVHAVFDQQHKQLQAGLDIAINSGSTVEKGEADSVAALEADVAEAAKAVEAAEKAVKKATDKEAAEKDAQSMRDIHSLAVGKLEALNKDIADAAAKRGVEIAELEKQTDEQHSEIERQREKFDHEMKAIIDSMGREIAEEEERAAT